MSNFNFRFVFLLVLFVAVAGRSTRAGNFFLVEKVKYSVTFGESDHNYLPGHLMRMGVFFKNNCSGNVKVSEELIVTDSTGVKVWNTVINLELFQNGNVTVPLMVPVPKTSGTFTLTMASNGNVEAIPSFVFNVVLPHKSPRLSKLLVHTPDSEEGLNKFLKTWGIKAPELSWGQVLLLGKKSWNQYVNNDKVITQLIDRALKREMSVIFIDFGPANANEDLQNKVGLPYDVSMSFVKAKSPEQSFILKTGYKELTYDLTSNQMKKWNGYYGMVVPATDMRFEGKGVKINAYATTGENPFRFPLVELIPVNGKGKIYFSQIITDGRLDETVKSPRNKPELPAYDPLAVQFLLNLISATVGDNLLK